MTGALRRRLAQRLEDRAPLPEEADAAAGRGPEPVFHIGRAAQICVRCGEPWSLGGSAAASWQVCQREKCSRWRHPNDRVAAG